MSMRLCNGNLGRIAARATVPVYDRGALRAGILHFGIGNFHRAHQAVYLDRLFALGRDHDWAIVGAGMRPAEEAMRAALAAQDWLTTVVEQTADAAAARVTGAMIDFLPPGDAAAIGARLADPSVRIVSMTITEGGYFLDAAGRLDHAHPAIIADAASPAAPKTVFGVLVKALRTRRDAGHAPFAVMSCDNIPHNGVVTRAATTGLARMVDPGLADWVEAEVAFPNGMVDRITPATGDRERRAVVDDFGIDDAWPVYCERFSQWVLEDRFPAGRPALEAVGVQFVADVAPYEAMKIRILNGGHAVIAYPSGLLGIELADAAMSNPLVRDFLDKVETDEIIPMVPPVPGIDLADYFATVSERFANPKIGDTIRRLCLDGSNRQPKFIVPSIRDRLAADRDVTGLALESALWCRYCAGVDERGAPIEPNDPNWATLTSVAATARETPAAWLAMRDVYGETGTHPALRERFTTCLHALWNDGVEATLRRYLSDRL